MTNQEFEQTYYPKYESVIKAIARKIAQRNDALMEDLISEGMIALWKLEPKKARDNPDAYIRQAIKFRMIDFVRKERPALFESLTPYLERGDQIVQDDDTHELRIVGGNALKSTKRQFLEDDPSNNNYRRERAAEDREEED